MGVTIHFEGSLRGESAYTRLIEKAQGFSDLNDWPTTPILEQYVTLTRVRDTEEAWDYVGPTKGIEIRPHENADPLRLEFDCELYIQEFCKTQFAPPRIHALIVELLRSVAAEFSSLSVEDEGELWDTGDMALLQRHLEACFNAIDAHLKDNPDHYGPVRVQGGRIVDLMERE